MIKPSELVPNEQGALKPSISSVTPEGVLSANELALHHAVNSSGGSGQGMSYWSGASRCGRKAVLAERKYSGYRDVRSTLPLLKNHFLVGRLYHAMQEGWRDPECEYRHDTSVSYVNVNVQEASRLFLGYASHWRRDLWGKVLATECLLPDTGPTADDIEKVFGAPVTGKLDMVVELTGEHLFEAQKRIPGLPVGRYVVDFKTADQPGSATAYELGLQTLWYPALWNWQHPDKPVSGVIYDVIYKRSRRAPRPFGVDDFGAFYFPVNPELSKKSTEALQGMVAQGKKAVDEFRPNRGECVSWRGEVCQFFNRECDVGVLL